MLEHRLPGRGRQNALPNTASCDNQPGSVQGFGFCRHYTGTGGGQQSHSGVIHKLPNGLQGYYIAGDFNQRRVSVFTNTERDPRRVPTRMTILPT